MKIIILLIALFINHSVYAATQGTLTIKGTVPQLLELEVTPESSASTLDLTTTAPNLKIAEVREKSNSNTGYKVLARSTNNGYLKNGNSQVPYTINYAGSNHTLTSSDTQVKNVGTRGVTVSSVGINYTGTALEALTAGDYTDSVVFTIQVN